MAISSAEAGRPPEGAGSRFFRRFRLLLAGLVVCRGLVYLCVMPPFEGWDEYQHVGYVVHVLETGRRAVLHETNVPQSLLAGAVAFPQARGVIKDQLGWLGAVDYDTFWERHDPRDPRRSAPAMREGWIELYQAQHAPLYYRLAAPLFAALGGVRNLRWSVGGLRLANVGLTAAAVWVALGGIRRLFRRERDAALIGLALAAHPLFLQNGARVANDALGVFLATVAVVGCLAPLSPPPARPTDRRRLAAWGLAVGAVIGLAALAKAVNFALLPFAAFCGLAAVARGRVAPGRAAVAGLVVAAGFLVVTQDELRFNYTRFGAPTSMQEAVRNRANGRTGADLIRTAKGFAWPKIVRRLWTRDLFYMGGWSFLRSHVKAVQTYQLALTLGLYGWAWRLVLARRRDLVLATTTAGLAACAVLCLSVTAALGYHMVQSKLAWGVRTTNPWYACPALPWFLVLAAGGGLAWPLGRLRAALPVALAAAGLSAEAVGIWGRMVPTYAGGATGLEALHRLACLQPGALGTPTLAAALAGQCAVVAALVVIWGAGAPGDEAAPGLLRGHHRPRGAAECPAEWRHNPPRI
jgi:hypothetical protein